MIIHLCWVMCPLMSALVACFVVICIHLFRGNFTCNIGADLSWESNLHRLYIINRTGGDTAVTQRRQAAKTKQARWKQTSGMILRGQVFCHIHQRNLFSKPQRRMVVLRLLQPQDALWIFLSGWVRWDFVVCSTCRCNNVWLHIVLTTLAEICGTGTSRRPRLLRSTAPRGVLD